MENAQKSKSKSNKDEYIEKFQNEQKLKSSTSNKDEI